MEKQTPGESVPCAPKCGSGDGKSMSQVADEFYKLARGESDGHYRGMLAGLLAAASIAGDDGLVTHINRHMGQLEANEPA
jgi:hypothetical protein